MARVVLHFGRRRSDAHHESRTAAPLRRIFRWLFGGLSGALAEIPFKLVDRDRLEVLAAQRAGLARYPQTLGQQQLQLVAEPLAPMAQVRALVRERALEELFAGEVLEMRVVDPALADPLIGQSVNVFEQQQPDHEVASMPGRPFSL